MRRAARVDSNQRAVIDALERAGVAVVVIGKPLDLLVCFRGETSLVEIKNSERVSDRPGSRLTRAQARFIREWPGKIAVVRTVEEAVRLVTGAAPDGVTRAPGSNTIALRGGTGATVVERLSRSRSG